MLKDTSLLVLIIAAAGLVVNIITLIVVIGVLKRFKKEAAKLDVGQAAAVEATVQKEMPAGGQSKPAAAAGAGVVFCRNCGSPFDSSNAACPQCNTPRGYRKEEGT
ncbi:MULTISPECIES: hypothetical protein [Neobacillus]|uniref:Uncharacterized protein n=1 Tax=Neobacillus rhizophilus TaxID=2833579 RepID=A0A942U7N7_9BACI|nr:MULTISPECIES: hypothetical protein [Neobacillus]MBS4212974.1 hypothetical protein [Neobacillus rhizophilus]MBU8918190.1 hypothetical protein [Bacillus sp. FJAT-29953]